MNFSLVQDVILLITWVPTTTETTTETITPNYEELKGSHLKWKE